MDTTPAEARRRDAIHIFEKTSRGPPSTFEYVAGAWIKGEAFSDHADDIDWLGEIKVPPELLPDPASAPSIVIPREYLPNPAQPLGVRAVSRLEALKVYQIRLPPRRNATKPYPLTSPVQLGADYFADLFKRQPILAVQTPFPPPSDMSLQPMGFGGWFSDGFHSDLFPWTVQTKSIDFQKADLVSDPTAGFISPRVPPPP